MKKYYRCKKQLMTLKVVNGEVDFGYGAYVKVGEEFFMDTEDEARAISNPEKTDRLISHNGFWVEVAKKKIKKYFDEISLV